MKKYKKHTKKQILLEGLRLVPSQGGSVKKRLTHNLIDLIKEATRDRNLDEKLAVIDTLRNSGIPPEAFASENGIGDTPNTMSSLFSDISNMLNVDQLCALLQGTPTQSTLDMIEITMSENHPRLVKYFYGTEDIKNVFLYLIDTQNK